jgi:GNAT superfamily N-acetyltransferase
MEFKTYIGKEIAEVLTPLGELRIAVFQDYPYLYEGSLDYEKDYLQTYVAAPESLVFSVWDKGQIVDATTCIPLKDETEEVRRPFEQAGIDVATVFYFGESILLHEYRGRGLGKRFFEARETHAASLRQYRELYFCSVERPGNHPLKPTTYQPLDAFWQSQGYRPSPLYSFFEWKDIDETTPSAKKMNYWCKKMGK